MINYLKWFFERLTEPTSYSGIGLLGLGGQQAINGDWKTAIITILSGIISFAAAEKNKF